MAEPQDGQPLAKPRSAEGKALRERFRYALQKLTAAQAQLVKDSTYVVGKDEVLRLFQRNNNNIGETLTALSKLAQA